MNEIKYPYYSTLLLAGAFSAFFFEYGVNRGVNAYWDSVNKGKIWKDVKKTLE